MRGILGWALAAFLLSSCVRIEFDRCQEQPPHPDCDLLDADRSDGGNAPADARSGLDPDATVPDAFGVDGSLPDAAAGE